MLEVYKYFQMILQGIITIDNIFEKFSENYGPKAHFPISTSHKWRMLFLDNDRIDGNLTS